LRPAVSAENDRLQVLRRYAAELLGDRLDGRLVKRAAELPAELAWMSQQDLVQARRCALDLVELPAALLRGSFRQLHLEVADFLRVLHADFEPPIVSVIDILGDRVHFGDFGPVLILEGSFLSGRKLALNIERGSAAQRPTDPDCRFGLRQVRFVAVFEQLVYGSESFLLPLVITTKILLQILRVYAQRFLVFLPDFRFNPLLKRSAVLNRCAVKSLEAHRPLKWTQRRI